MTIAILYIALGKYVMFWDEFYKSATKHFLPNIHKEYFVFTDAKDLKHAHNKDVHIIKEKFKPWPHATLKRFEFFLKIRDQLQKFDYIFFCNANLRILGIIGNEILPDEQHEGLTVVLHPYQSLFPKESYSYERNPKSTAYIPHGQGQYYFTGGFNGGSSKAFLKMCEVLAKNIQRDEKNHIIAVWHDESHLNHYLLNKKPLILNASYFVPQSFQMPKKIIVLDKANYAEYNQLRNFNTAPVVKPKDEQITKNTLTFWYLDKYNRTKHYNVIKDAPK